MTFVYSKKTYKFFNFGIFLVFKNTILHAKGKMTVKHKMIIASHPIFFFYQTPTKQAIGTLDLLSF